MFSLDFSRKRALAPKFSDNQAGQTMFLRQNVVIWCDVEVVFGAFRAYGNFAKAVLRATNDE